MPETNLVANPGFEQPANPDGLPSGGWWLYSAQADTQVKSDQAGPRKGKYSVALQAHARAKSVLVSAPFPVAPGDELRFETWVRAECTQPSSNRAFAGIAFRNREGGVFKRDYFAVEAVGNAWSKITGTAQSPHGVSAAEVHLGYTNSPGMLWFDDIVATITSPVSFSLAKGPEPWAGQQDITVLAANRQTSRFEGSIHVVVGKQHQNLPVTLEPETSRQVTVPVTLNGVGAHNYALCLLDSTGTPLRELKGKFQTKAPLALYPACPCYHTVGNGKGDTRVEARVNLNPAKRSGLFLVVEVTDAGGKQIQTATADASQGDDVGLNVQLPIQASGVFEIVARLRDGAGKEIARASTDVHVSPRAASVVTIGSDGFLRIEGKPHFPIGLYSSGRYEELGQAGFTATHNYGITTGEATDPINPNESQVKQLLDRSWSNGMRMMVELPRKAIEIGEWQQIRRRIETFRHHPGLLCWGSEERVARGVAPLSHIAALYRLVHKLDPNHPLVLGDTRDAIQKLQEDRRDFFPDACMDIGIWWWYPIPLKGPDGNGLEERNKPAGVLQPPSWLTTTHSKKPLWIAIQSYQHPRLDARFPTPAEYRCMAYLSIINGVKGLWFYTGSGQRDYYGKPAGLLNKPNEAHWDYVQKLVRELREVSPIVMSPASKYKLTISPADAPVEFALRESNGKLYLIAANKASRVHKVQFRGDVLASRQATVLYETHPAAVQADSLADVFSAFAVRVYELE
ncbi:MAG TPA: hypothetical protein PLC99_07055 [Verrucomicrobiota bacterium]|nr:hypothetical protein [Verrucomicrobiota bacterium]